MNIDGKSDLVAVTAPVSFAVARRAAESARASVERLRKGQEIHVRQNVQQVVGGLASLTRAGDIGEAQSSAAERWYRDYVMGIVGARDPEARSSGRAPDIHAA